MKSNILDSTAGYSFLFGEIERYGIPVPVIHTLETFYHNICIKDESRFRSFDITPDKKLPSVIADTLLLRGYKRNISGYGLYRNPESEMNRKAPGYIIRYFKERNGISVFVMNFTAECRVYCTIKRII